MHINVHGTAPLMVQVHPTVFIRELREKFRRDAHVRKGCYLNLGEGAWEIDEGTHRGGVFKIRDATAIEIQKEEAIQAMLAVLPK